jgi:phenylpyruvate tautomerase PptA (4-oxalocrotonate tautomerase family)
MSNARHILMQIHAVIGSKNKTEREVYEFCSWIEVQVMTELIGALPIDKQDQVIDQFMTLPPHKKEGVFYPYYTVEYIQGRVKKATKKAILQQVVEPHWDKLSATQQEDIRTLLEEIER